MHLFIDLFHINGIEEYPYAGIVLGAEQGKKKTENPYPDRTFVLVKARGNKKMNKQK